MPNTRVWQRYAALDFGLYLNQVNDPAGRAALLRRHLPLFEIGGGGCGLLLPAPVQDGAEVSGVIFPPPPARPIPFLKAHVRWIVPLEPPVGDLRLKAGLEFKTLAGDARQSLDALLASTELQERKHFSSEI